ncbi:MAG: helicase-related protein, partial [Vicinamibacterales bacterium]
MRIRRERWRVAAVELRDACPLVTLDGLGPPNVHEQRQLLVPFEVVEPLAHLDAAGVPHLPWRAGRTRWRRAVRSALVADGPWTRLHGVDPSHIDVWPYQLEPAITVLEGRATRLLLADAVGLGKTVQAGVLLVELLARGAAQSALVLTPAGLRDQWRQELASRFNLAFDVVDSASAARLAAELPLGVNPWTTRRLAITSVDFVKRPEVLSAVRAHAWDVVIVDEAHLVSPGSDRHAAVSLLCAAALFVVLLTATPHNGDREAFASLCSLGLTDGAPPDACHIFRRSRSDVGMPLRRRVHRLQVSPSPAEVRMHAALDQYAVAVRADAADTHAGELLVSTLRKRALSSPSSLRASVDRRLHALNGELLEEEEDEQLRLPLDDGAGEFDAGDSAPALDLPVLRDRRREHGILRCLRHAADEASHAESKLRALARLLRRLARRRERVLVFTEYRDTLLHVQRRVAPDALVLHGGLDRQERGLALDTFTSGRAPVLLATDTAGEGLNLHQSCRCVVHLEL